MKILTLSQFYTPDITAPAFRVTEMMDYLNSNGNKVQVVTAYPHKNIIKDSIKDIENVIRVHLPDTENKGFLGYIYLYLTFLVKSIVKGYQVGRRMNPDIVWATSPPIFVGLAGWILSRSLGVGFALDIRDIWPDSAVAAGQISVGGFAYKIGRWLEKFLYRNADVITCVAKPMRDYIKSYTNTKVKVIYNGVDNDSLQEKYNEPDINILEQRSFKKNTKKILYAGNFGHVQQLDILIEVFCDLDKSDLDYDWEIFFIGGGVRKEHLIGLVEQHKLNKDVHFLNAVPKHEVFSYLKSADVLFIHLQDSEVLRLTIPSKVFDYMLANRPLLAGIYGEGKEIIESVSGNVVFESGNKESLKRAFMEVEKKMTNKNCLENASVIFEVYNRDKQAGKLNKILMNTFKN